MVTGNTDAAHRGSVWRWIVRRVWIVAMGAALGAALGYAIGLPDRQLAVLAGAVAGGLLGTVALLVWWLVQRPVLTEESAAADFPAERVFSVWVDAPARPRPDPSEWQVRPPGVPDVVALAATGEAPDGASVWCLLAERRRKGDWRTRAVARDVVSRVEPAERDVVLFRARRQELEPLDPAVLAPGEQPAGVVAVVSEGASAVAVRALADVARSAGEGIHRVLVFVRRRPAPALARRSLAEVQPAAAPTGPLDAGSKPRKRAAAPEPFAFGPSRPIPPGKVAAETSDAAEATPLTAVDAAESTVSAIISLPEADAEAEEQGDLPVSLAAALSDPRAEIRLKALTALLDRPSSELLDAVAARLDDPQPRIRALAVSVVAAIKEYEARD